MGHANVYLAKRLLVTASEKLTKNPDDIVAKAMLTWSTTVLAEHYKEILPKKQESTLVLHKENKMVVSTQPVTEKKPNLFIRFWIWLKNLLLTKIEWHNVYDIKKTLDIYKS